MVGEFAILADGEQDSILAGILCGVLGTVRFGGSQSVWTALKVVTRVGKSTRVARKPLRIAYSFIVLSPIKAVGAGRDCLRARDIVLSADINY